jgi:hypothetical protein
MSSTTTSSSNFQVIAKALADYAEQTGLDLTKNPFADKLQNCNSAEAISELLQDRAKAFKEYRDGNRKLINCLNPLVHFFHTFSGILGESLAVSPCKSLRPFRFSFYATASRSRFHLPRRSLSASTFSSGCVSPLPSSLYPTHISVDQAASGVSKSYDALVDLFECVGNFLQRLQIYTEIPLTPTMTNIVVKILVEVLSVLALAMKQIKQGRCCEPIIN